MSVPCLLSGRLSVQGYWYTGKGYSHKSVQHSITNYYAYQLNNILISSFYGVYYFVVIVIIVVVIIVTIVIFQLMISVPKILYNSGPSTEKPPGGRGAVDSKSIKVTVSVSLE